MKSRLEWKVGLFVFIGLVLLAGLLLQFSKGITFFQPTYDILLQSANVSGLKARSSVLMSGVQVGTVSVINLSGDGKSVTITLHIIGRYKIHQDARFVIEQSGFLGDQFVSILPTNNKEPVFENGGRAYAEAPFDLQEVARSASGFIQHLNEAATNINSTVAEVRLYFLNKETLTNLATAAGNLRIASERALGTVDNIDSLLASNAPALSTSATNLVFFSEQMSQFAGSLSAVLATNGPGINAAVKNIESSTAVLKNLLDDVQAGKGPAGTLLKNEQFSASMLEIADNLSITTSNLNRLGLWGILWSHKPRTNEPPALTSPKNPLR
jgi:phospholipid/cholesterol/gamma-HCH transport system substrate-binding protein